MRTVPTGCTMCAVRGLLGVVNEYVRALRATVGLRISNLDPMPFAVAIAVVMLGAVVVYAVGTSYDGADDAVAREDAALGPGRDDRVSDRHGRDGPGTSAGGSTVPPAAQERPAPEPTSGPHVAAPGAGAGMDAGPSPGDGTAAVAGASGTTPRAPGSTSTTGGAPSTSAPDTTVPPTPTTTSTTAPLAPPPPPAGPLAGLIEGLAGLFDTFS
jgi:hypothetical protein